MRQNATNHYLAAREVPFTINGQNLVTMRRAKLRLIAKSLKLNESGATSKNQLLHMIVGKLKAMGADSELTSL